jgi:hypothetical protein
MDAKTRRKRIFHENFYFAKEYFENGGNSLIPASQLSTAHSLFNTAQTTNHKQKHSAQ